MPALGWVCCVALSTAVTDNDGDLCVKVSSSETPSSSAASASAAAFLLNTLQSKRLVRTHYRLITSLPNIVLVTSNFSAICTTYIDIPPLTHKPPATGTLANTIFFLKTLIFNHSRFGGENIFWREMTLKLRRSTVTSNADPKNASTDRVPSRKVDDNDHVAVDGGVMSRRESSWTFLMVRSIAIMILFTFLHYHFHGLFLEYVFGIRTSPTRSVEEWKQIIASRQW
jgi:hypothetical protein